MKAEHLQAVPWGSSCQLVYFNLYMFSLWLGLCFFWIFFIFGFLYSALPKLYVRDNISSLQGSMLYLVCFSSEDPNYFYHFMLCFWLLASCLTGSCFTGASLFACKKFWLFLSRFMSAQTQIRGLAARIEATANWSQLYPHCFTFSQPVLGTCCRLLSKPLASAFWTLQLLDTRPHYAIAEGGFLPSVCGLMRRRTMLLWPASRKRFFAKCIYAGWIIRIQEQTPSEGKGFAVERFWM